MGTYYIDKRVSVNGDGSQATPWKQFNEAGSSANVPANSTVIFVPGSGPYYPSDFTYLAQPMLYPNHRAGGTTTWDLGGNTLTSELDLSVGGEWHESTVAGLYYYTSAGSANPNIATALSGIVDGVWDAQSTSIFGAYPGVTDATHVKKWGYGNADILGFNTVYVRGINPSISPCSVLISISNTPIVKADSVANSAFHIFKNGAIRGGGEYSARFAVGHSLEQINIVNCDDYGVEITGVGSEYRNCKFENCGHQAFGVLTAHNVALYNCHFENVHLIKKLVSAFTRTTTVRNCTSKNLLAGAFQHDVANETLVEDHNQFHIDLVNIHGGDALAFTTGTRQWTQTDATDLPPSIDTSTTTSVDPLITSDYHLQPTSPCIGAGTAIAGITTDIEGNQLYPPYNIGPYGAAAGALTKDATDSPGRAKYNLTPISNTGDTTIVDDHTYSLANADQVRKALGWVYGGDHWAYSDAGVAKVVTGAVIKANASGPDAFADANGFKILDFPG